MMLFLLTYNFAQTTSDVIRSRLHDCRLTLFIADHDHKTRVIDLIK